MRSEIRSSEQQIQATTISLEAVITTKQIINTSVNVFYFKTLLYKNNY